MKKFMTDYARDHCQPSNLIYGTFKSYNLKKKIPQQSAKHFETACCSMPFPISISQMSILSQIVFGFWDLLFNRE